MNARDESLLEDMLSYARDAVELLGETDTPTLAGDKLRRYAVIRAIEVVGEAAGRTSDETRAALPSLPWRQVIGMRNVLIHCYAGLDLNIVVRTVRVHLPVLIEQLGQVLGEGSE